MTDHRQPGPYREHRPLVGPPPSAHARTRGFFFVHSAPRALASHLQWQVTATWGPEVEFDWRPQPLLPGHVRAEASWHGTPGSAGRLISTLRGWGRVRAEATEEPSPGHEGERYSLTPELGVFRAAIGPCGDILVSEERLRAALARGSAPGGDVPTEMSQILGEPWDAELEPFRHSGDASPVRWMHRVG